VADVRFEEAPGSSMFQNRTRPFLGHADPPPARPPPLPRPGEGLAHRCTKLTFALYRHQSAHCSATVVPVARSLLSERRPKRGGPGLLPRQAVSRSTGDHCESGQTDCSRKSWHAVRAWRPAVVQTGADSAARRRGGTARFDGNLGRATMWYARRLGLCKLQLAIPSTLKLNKMWHGR
jgi:hypothetical protein